MLLKDIKGLPFLDICEVCQLPLIPLSLCRGTNSQTEFNVRKEKKNIYIYIYIYIYNKYHKILHNFNYSLSYDERQICNLIIIILQLTTWCAMSYGQNYVILSFFNE